MSRVKTPSRSSRANPSRSGDDAPVGHWRRDGEQASVETDFQYVAERHWGRLCNWVVVREDRGPLLETDKHIQSVHLGGVGLK